MKRLALVIASIFLAAIHVQAEETIIVGATPVPHAEILEQVKPLLAEKGYKLEIKEFTDYVIPNLALDDGDLDANFFQHRPYLLEFNKNKNTKLVATVNVHLEPMGVYSHKIKNLADLPIGASVAVPNDPTNESRALEVLVNAGLITLKDAEFKTKLDVAENPKKLSFKEIDAPQLPRVLDDVDIAVINTNYALPAGLNPVKDALAIESKDSPYANIIVVKEGKENDPKTKALNEAITSDKIRLFIQEKYNGAIIEAF